MLNAPKENNRFRIGQLNTGVRGGAAIACQRLNLGLRSRGVESVMISKALEDQLGEGQTTCRNSLSELYGRIRLKFSSRKDMIRENIHNYEIYSSPYSGYRLRWNSYILNADILNLHWVSNFIDFDSFFDSKKKQKIVWSIHDLNPFLGGLHYTLDLKRVTPALKSYEEQVMKEKQNVIRGKGINFIFLSQWLYSEALNIAPWLRNEKVHFIPNGIQTNIFKFKSRHEVLSKLGLNPNKKSILFISESLDNYRKGFDILLEALTPEFTKAHNIELVAIGRVPSQTVSHIKYVGPVHNFELLADYYNAVDGFILPSRQDNLPNVMLEALCCGCPVVAFNTGGMSEYLNEGNGVLCSEIGSLSLREGLISLLRSEFQREEIAKSAQALFDIEVSVEKYLSLYHNILESKS